MNPRRIGFAMVYAGAATQAVGVLWEAIRRSDAGATRGNLFDLGVPAHALFFAGLCAVLIGFALIAVGQWLYAPAAGPGRRFVQVLAPVFAFTLVAGCASAADHSATKASKTKATTATAKIKLATSSEAPTFEGHTVLTQTATGKSPCEKASPTPASPGEVGGGNGGSASNDADTHGPRGMLAPIPVSTAQRKELIQQMSEARSVVAKYPTVASARAAGYQESTVYVPCIGAHFTNLGLVTQFNPSAPSELLYDGTTPTSRIVGLSYLVWHPGGPPPGFAGPNDVWHQHNANGGLCLRGGQVVGGESMSQKTCALIGGKKSAQLMANVWMVHAWVAPGWECSWGVFAGECPELGGTIGANAFTNK
jgi:hypothetical protein